MAVLSDPDVTELYAEFMRRASRNRTSIPISKPDLLAVFVAANVWKGANDASYNAALPLPGRTALSLKDKALVLMMILERTYELTP
jgi:hypothetical protein